jgi:N6-L-threonylcarbamoyladenine synthase
MKGLNGKILAIESSCDDTSAAVIVDGNVISNITASQIVHSEYGGVVPELASRKHQKNILPVIQQALKEAKISKNELQSIAFTRGPGLLGSLIVGVTFAKALALALQIPLIEVNHMHAHVLAHFIESPYPDFPFLCLTVSGGHTQIVKVESPLKMIILGSTVDDAAGEAFDKTGKMLGLSYPAGPIIDKYAQSGQAIYDFPEPKIQGLDFSFSGLKTSILYFIRDEMKKDNTFLEHEIYNICASVQERIISILLSKLEKAALQENITHIAIAGGVSANSALRKGIKSLCEKYKWTSYIPAFQHCTDNAAMIAIAGAFKYENREFVGQDISPAPRLAF